jgi:hypothetical protein
MVLAEFYTPFPLYSASAGRERLPTPCKSGSGRRQRSGTPALRRLVAAGGAGQLSDIDDSPGAGETAAMPIALRTTGLLVLSSLIASLLRAR